MSQHLFSWTDAEKDGLEEYLTRLYKGVFTPEAISTHLDNHVGFAFADYAVAVTAPHLPRGARVLDLGSGFGSYVLRARDAGLDAIGIELAEFEVEFARARLRRLRPGDNSERIYRIGDVTQIGLGLGTFDAITLWNVLEHVEDAAGLLRSADALLRPGGQILVVCPNYDAARDEAHYHVPWNAQLSRDRGEASRYLRSLGRDPSYFESSIFFRTNREVIGILENLGYELFELSNRRPMSFRLRSIGAALRNLSAIRVARSVGKPSVEIAAIKTVVAMS